MQADHIGRKLVIGLADLIFMVGASAFPRALAHDLTD